MEVLWASGREKLTNKITFARDLRGQIDLQFCWLILRKLGKSNEQFSLRSDIATAILANDKAFEEFWKGFSQFNLGLPEVTSLFLNSLAEENTSEEFLGRIEASLFYLLSSEYRELRLKITKLLFLGLNIYANNDLAKCLHLLNKILTKNLIFSYRPEHTRSMTEHSSELETESFKDKLIFFGHSSKIRSEKFGLIFELVPSQAFASFMKENHNSLHQLVICNADLSVQKQLLLTMEVGLSKDIVRINSKQLFMADQGEYNLFNNDFVVNILDKNFIQKKVVQSFATRLAQNNKHLLVQLSLKRLRTHKELGPNLQFLSLLDNPLFNYSIIKGIATFLKRVVRKFACSGFVIKDMISNITLARISYQKFETIKKLKEKIVTEERLVSINQIIMPLHMLNPLHVFVVQKVMLKYPSQVFISRESLNILLVAGKFHLRSISLKKFVNATLHNFMNYLNCSFYLSLNSMPISRNFVVKQKHSRNPLIDRLVENFFLFIRNKTNLYIISKARDVYASKMSADSVSISEQKQIATLGSKIYYFPIVLWEGSVNNSILGCALLAQDKMLIFFEKYFEIEEAQVNISFWLKHVYKQLKQNYQGSDLDSWWVQTSSDAETRYVRLYEFFHNRYAIILKSPRTIIGFCFLPSLPESAEQRQIVEKTINNPNNSDFKFYSVKSFFKSFDRPEPNLNNWSLQISRLIKFLNECNIKTASQLSSLFSLSQIKFKKRYFNTLYSLLLLFKNYFSGLGASTSIDSLVVEEVLSSLKLKNVVVITPEYGEFVKIGGLAVMIEDLCNGLVVDHEDIVVLMPYYDFDKTGKKDYLKAKEVIYSHNMVVAHCGIKYEIGVHVLRRKNITFYFLHNMWLFPSIYQTVRSKVRQVAPGQANMRVQPGLPSVSKGAQTGRLDRAHQ